MWALGVVLYIMLLGCHPFDPHGRGDEREMAEAILKGVYRFDLHGDQLRLSPDAKDLISGLLDPNPATRYTGTDVLEHPFIAKYRANKNMGHDDILPMSWTKQGFKVDRDDPAYQVLEQNCTKDERLKPFSTSRSGEAFARVLLMAGASHGRNVYTNPQGDNEITSERLYLDAYQMFELNSKGKLTPQSMQSLLRLTGDEAEDDVVVSYHKNHDKILKKTESTHTDRANGNGNDSQGNATSSNATSDDGSSDQSGVKNAEDGITFNEFKAFLQRLDCVTRNFEKGEVVFEQGSVPQGVYILLNGKARLEYKDAVNQGKGQFSYAKLTPGSIFGEAACLKGAKARSSTIRCTKNSEVLFIPKDIFLRALAGSPALNEVIFKVAMKQQAIRLHELVAYLRPDGLVVRHLPPGAMLFRQGQKADYMYLIRDGIVGSNTSAPSSRAKGAEEMSVKLAERGPGDLIGTSAATGGGGTRYSSAKCITPVTVVGIPMDELTRLRREEPVFRFYLQNLIHTRKEFWQLQISDLERGVSEPQLLPLLLNDDNNDADSNSGFFDREIGSSGQGESETLSGEAAAAELAKALVRSATRHNGQLDQLKRAGTRIRQDKKRAQASGQYSATSGHASGDDSDSPSSSGLDSQGLPPSWTWAGAASTAVSYVNPYAWYAWSVTPKSVDEESSNSASIDEKFIDNKAEEAGRASPQGLDLISNKHLKAFEEYARAVAKMSHLRLSGGDYVFKKGDTPKHFFIVDSGTVSVEYVNERGKVLSVAQLGPGDHFGEQVLMEHLPEYVTSVRCMSNAEILAMPAEEFHKLVGDGQSTFAVAIKHAMKLRQHRWVRNLLKLAKEDKRVRRQEAVVKKSNERSFRESTSSRNARYNNGSGAPRGGGNVAATASDTRSSLVEREEREFDAHEEPFIDKDKTLGRARQPVSRAPSSSSSGSGHPVNSGVNRVVLQPGDKLFSQGDPVDAIYMVHRGQVDLKYSGDHQRNALNLPDEEALRPGDTFGLEHIRTGALHDCDAVCVASNTVVSKIPRETMDQLIDGHEFVSQQLRRHARRTVPMNELERRARVDLQKHGSYSSTLKKASQGRPKNAANQDTEQVK